MEQQSTSIRTVLIVNRTLGALAVIVLTILAYRIGRAADLILLLSVIPLIVSLWPSRYWVWAVQAVVSTSIFILWLTDFRMSQSVDSLVWVAAFILALTSVTNGELRFLRAKYTKESQDLIARSRINQIAANHDPLTGTLNRRGLLTYLDDLDQEDVALVIIDCDHFKDVNDSYGHLAGDEYLQALAARMTTGIKKSDLVARWGGDEFLLLIHADIHETREILNRLNAELRENPILTSGGSIPGSISAGVSLWKRGESVEKAMSIADSMLYSAKQSGRSQIAIDSNALDYGAERYFGRDRYGN